jgi:HEPN domain-containing protein
MPVDRQILTQVRLWVAKAENDLKAISQLLQFGANCPTDVVCFHAQQCVEKYVKAALVAHGRPFPRTHDLAELAHLLRPQCSLSLSSEELDRLTDHAVMTRYPGEDEPISLAHARREARLARRVRTEIRKSLPKSALRRIRR